MANARRFAALGADHHDIGRMQRHRLLDNTCRDAPARLHMLLGDIDALYDHLVLAGHRTLHRSTLAAVFARQHQNSIAFMHMQLGQVQGLLLMLLRCCHSSFLPFPLPFGLLTRSPDALRALPARER